MLVLCNVIGQVSRYRLGRPHLRGFVDLFDLNVEANIPSFFSSLLLVIVTGLLGLIGTLERRRAARFAKHWSALAIIFAYLSVDEAAQLHEKIGFNVAEYVDTQGFPSFYAWVLPFSILVVVLGLAFLPFLRALPASLRTLFVAAGALYVGAALGLEIVDALYTRTHGYGNLSHALLYTTEEAGEMCGLILFIYALLSHLRRSDPRITIGFLASSKASSAA